MADDRAWLHAGEGAAHHVQICTADRRCGDPDYRVGRLFDRGIGDIIEADVAHAMKRLPSSKSSFDVRDRLDRRKFVANVTSRCCSGHGEHLKKTNRLAALSYDGLGRHAGAGQTRSRLAPRYHHRGLTTLS
ncbi:hypothetical protein [Palleronia sp.]|uniref:hypothetical protein n=1 Tax=Palleronia sp. TaxID=1940284 RepID=UPI0035C7E972